MENQKFDEEKFRTATELNIQFQEEFGKKRIDIYEERDLYKRKFEILREASEKLVTHLEMILGDIKLSGTYHLKERLKSALEGVKDK